MDDDGIPSDDMARNLDLNIEPANPGVELDHYLELGIDRSRIEDRIRRLEEVTLGIRQRQMMQQAQNPPPESSNSNTVEPRALERTVEWERNSTRAHLVAKALEIDLEVKKDVGNGGNFYDCNICLDMAKDPIVTCCGHLFCWSCFYRLSYVDSTAKECPVCKGEVVDENITPIYSSADNSNSSEMDSGLRIPPRPPAHRVESLRQQRASRRFSHIQVGEALRRIRPGVGSIPEQPRLLGEVLSESFSSFSSTENNRERLAEEFETFVNGSLLLRTGSRVPVNNGGDLFSSSAAVIQTELQTVDSTTETVFPLEIPETAAAVENVTLPRRSSSRRRSGASRVSEVQDGVSREPRRRRLR